MTTKLGKWTLNSRKWREENGLTTPEWVMFVENRQYTSLIMNMAFFGLGIICATYITAIN